MAWLNERRPAFREPLVPVVVQHVDSGAVLMLAYADATALAATERTGEAHFWSRSRDELWRKGATSGNVLRIVDLATDCDLDAVRYRVRAAGPACHTGATSCFDVEGSGGGDAPRLSLPALEAVIAERRSASADESYTARLLATGVRRPAEKLVEEAGELAAAALAGTTEEVAAEAADLLYHMLVLLASRELPLHAVERLLGARHEDAA